jgi:hypothetical protein
MGNCLVIKWKVAVDNSSLRTFGCITLFKTSNESITLTLVFNGTIEVTGPDGTKNSHTGDGVVPMQVTFSGEGNIVLSNPEAISTIIVNSGDAYLYVEDLMSCVNLKDFQAFDNVYFKGSLEKLDSLQNIEKLVIPKPGELYGNLSSFYNKVSLSLLGLVDNVNITGDWANLARNQYGGAGRDNGSITIPWVGSLTSCAFNGTVVPNTGQGTLSWSSSTNKVTLVVEGEGGTTLETNLV